MTDVDGEEVRLTMPATPQLLRVARLTAAGLAGRLGFSVDEIEDVKIAVDELCFALVGSKGRPGSLTLTYRLGNHALIIDGEGVFTSVVGESPAPSELSAQILAAVVDEHEFTRDGNTMRFRLVKRRLVA
ncbi:MAG: putative anti-sigma regulatory factor, serine/threonine protein kinase [Acidimicrobiales bacterium]|nr:putative anti-sigma regulatory factor, serine/threonine protein kinase [Acidimicrobiales bacterium]